MRLGHLGSLLLSVILLCPRAVDAEANGSIVGPILLYSSLHLGDIATTEIGLHEGLKEGNPFGQDRSSRLALHMGALAVEIYADRHLKGPWKWVFRGGMLAIHGYAIGHNIHAIREHRRIYGH